MLRVGLIGWRGMVGSVLLERMRAEGDFSGLEPVFFSTSQVGAAAPPEAGGAPLLDAHDVDSLVTCPVLLTCQGGEYTERLYAQLRRAGWKGFWIDAASTLRMADDAIIVLDPVNGQKIQQALERGIKTYVGGNCTVSLLLMALAPLFQQGWVEWVSSMTYQAASGAGAAKMLELVRQMTTLSSAASASAGALEVDRQLIAAQRDAAFPVAEFGAPLAGSLIPWIDRALPDGRTREEWKGEAELNRILGLQPAVPADGICVRVGTMRCHSQAVCIKMNRDLPVADIEAHLAAAHAWVRVVPNDPESTRRDLTPTAVSGTLTVPVGRLRKMTMGPTFLSAFTVGDQLLWGAAEPLRRMLGMLRQHLAQ